MKILRLEKEPKNEKYANLIEYAFKKSDAISLTIRYDIFLSNIVRFDKICELTNLDKEELFKEYKKNGIKNIYKIIKNTDFREYMTKQVVKVNIDAYQKNYKEYIKLRERMEKIKSKLKEDLILERHNPEWCGNESTFYFPEDFNKGNIDLGKTSKVEYKYKGEYIYDICFYKLSNSIKEFLLQENRLYKLSFPNYPEDICFYKNGYCCMETISHENRTFIYTKSEEEIRDLNDIGLKFKEYEISKEDVPYEEYVINKR